jgi:OOP family OmpA-OmpF porin
MAMQRYFIALAGALLLGACSISSEIAAVKQMPVKGDAFSQALHAEYIALATIEDDEGDIDNAEFFNNKAKMVAESKKVLPTTFKERTIPKNAADELEAARIALMAALGANGRTKAPKDAAHAQVMFDCWMEEQEENYQPADIAKCRKAFDLALKKVEDALSQRPTASPAAMPTATQGPFVVYFPFKSAKLDAAAMAVIRDAAAAAKGKGATVSGHTDRAGSDAYNMRLSADRAAAVAKALAEAGVPKKSIKRTQHGETQPAVPTADGAKEPKNRRVEIVIK